MTETTSDSLYHTHRRLGYFRSNAVAGQNRYSRFHLFVITSFLDAIFNWNASIKERRFLSSVRCPEILAPDWQRKSSGLGVHFYLLRLNLIDDFLQIVITYGLLFVSQPNHRLINSVQLISTQLLAKFLTATLYGMST